MTVEEMERKLAFYEKKMNDPNTSRYWREKAQHMYWHYLDLLTQPGEK